ncbi:MAG: sigma 54-interacting transcriptional regulator [Desulfobacteraceae bacterium]|jgi:transcriptional regulator with PAS, ATPase and Fis domain|nr:sigma 54-interacting transcriptional regulator [Desulfobacteraceae bacterium]
MKQSRIYISLYIIFPFIFTGFTIFAAIVSYRLTKYSFIRETDPVQPIFWFIVFISLLAYVSGFLMVRLILKPMEKFIEDTSKFPTISKAKKANEKDWSVDKIQQFTNVFDQVTSVLSRIDARHFFPNIIGESLEMRRLLSLIKKVAPTDSTVLILGESGTGKELVATSIHENSEREDKAFIKLNCAAIPAELLESELFGHEKGAFTGASGRKPGKFDMANEGTLFLDEIGDMPHNLQSKILRVLQEQEFYRVGGSATIKVNVRIIASTNKNLEEMVREGAFREDLFHRLNVFTLHLPPLRDRKEDIPLLVDYLLQNAPKKLTISPMALQMLTAFSWPGNIRELKNTIESASVIAENGIIKPTHLPAKITGVFDQNQITAGKNTAKISLDERLKEIEKSIIIEALKKTGGVQVRATELLGINQRSLWHRIKKYDIDVKGIKNYEL